MVIKAIQLSAMEAARWIAVATVISTFIWSVGGFIAFLLWSAYRDDIIETAGIASSEDVRRLESALTEAAQSFTQLSRQIVVLSRPDVIASYREPPRPTDGFCMAGQDCTISVFVERSPRAVSCQIIGPRSELLMLIDGREYAAPPITLLGVINLESTPRALSPTFAVPRGVPAGTATATIRTRYTGCTWQIDGEPPAIQDSPIFELEIRP